MRIVHSRLQHGVGQGSFHSASVEVTDIGGEHFRFDYVYDCGALVGRTASPHLRKSIKRMDLSQRPDSGDKAVIDALILSHFDRDHIIGAELLVRKCMVRRVYVPYLAPTELAFVLASQEGHHGAAPIGGPKFFNPALISFPGMNAVVSAGTTNTYGHPRASVLKEALAEGACLHVVTEECWLGFHEVVDLELP